MTRRQAERQMRRNMRQFTNARGDRERARERESAAEARMREDLLRLDPSFTPACLSGMDGFDLARVYAQALERLDTTVDADFFDHLVRHVLPTNGAVGGAFPT